MIKYSPYWLETKPIVGTKQSPKDGSIAIIGSGLTAVSSAYWLYQKGFKDITIIDYRPEEAATFRNCGHILHGTVESMQAFAAIHGLDKAEQIWKFSIDCCDLIKATIKNLNISCNYRQDGYLVIAIDEVELQEIKNSIKLMNDMGFQSSFVDKKTLTTQGFKNIYGARYERGSAQAHPVKFRNGILSYLLEQGINYHSGIKVEQIEEKNSNVVISSNQQKFLFEAAVIATNAYAPLTCSYIKDLSLIEPFRGQIIVSSPLKKPFAITYPHSFDHGYEYALITPDNRLMIGGWRNNVSGRDTNSYSLKTKSTIEQGLKSFVDKYYNISEQLSWDYSWSGIMAASNSSLPYIGPISTRVFLCLG
ncbi:MAG: FAD-dependent oxidoreductase, partial [Francisellaceae bacterium]|nr:FAD-dependent oxidoreductase [Francisellaceae bacterium]